MYPEQSIHAQVKAPYNLQQVKTVPFYVNICVAGLLRRRRATRCDYEIVLRRCSREIHSFVMNDIFSKPVYTCARFIQAFTELVCLVTALIVILVVT